MITVAFRILLPLLIYHVHLVNVGRTEEVEEKNPKNLFDDMQTTKNKIERFDPYPYVAAVTEEKDFEFSGDDGDGEFSGDDDDGEFSGESELIEFYNWYHELDKNANNYNVTIEKISWDDEGFLEVESTTSGCNTNFNDTNSVNADLIQMLRNLKTKCVLYQNNDTSNFIIYC